MHSKGRAVATAQHMLFQSLSCFARTDFGNLINFKQTGFVQFIGSGIGAIEWQHCTAMGSSMSLAYLWRRAVLRERTASRLSNELQCQML